MWKDLRMTKFTIFTIATNGEKLTDIEMAKNLPLMYPHRVSLSYEGSKNLSRKIKQKTFVKNKMNAH